MFWRRTMPFLSHRGWTLLLICLLVVPTALVYPQTKHALPNFRVAAISGYCSQTKECSPCSASPDLCVKWGSDWLAKSRSYVGSGARFDSIVAKILAGQDIHIGVFGGSVSACAELAEPNSTCWPYRLAAQLNKRFSYTGATFHVTNGAVASSSSVLALACGHLRIPNPVDLMIIDFALNDPLGVLINRSLGQLFRSLLTTGRAKDILAFDFYSPVMGFYSAADSINSLAQFFDIPMLGNRNILYHLRHTPAIREWSDFFTTDQWRMGHHPSPLGHELASDLMLSFFDQQVCSHASRSAQPLSPIITPSLPLGDPWQYKFDNAWSSNFDETAVLFESSRDKLFCEEAIKLPVDEKSVGFVEGHWKTKSFLVGSKAGDKLILELQPYPALQCITIFYWRSRTLGLGKAACTINDNPASFFILDGYWDSALNTQEYVTAGCDLSQPIEKLECEIMAPDQAGGNQAFRIAAIALTEHDLQKLELG